MSIKLVCHSQSHSNLHLFPLTSLTTQPPSCLFENLRRYHHPDGLVHLPLLPVSCIQRPLINWDVQLQVGSMYSIFIIKKEIIYKKLQQKKLWWICLFWLGKNKTPSTNVQPYLNLSTICFFKLQQLITDSGQKKHSNRPKSSITGDPPPNRGEPEPPPSSLSSKHHLQKTRIITPCTCCWGVFYRELPRTSCFWWNFLKWFLFRDMLIFRGILHTVYDFTK